MSRGARRHDSRPARLARWAVAIAIALAAHGVGLLFLLFGGVSLFGPATPVDPAPMTMRAVPESAWAQNRQIDPNKSPRERPTPVEVKPAPPPPEKKKEELPKGKVVDVAPGNGEKPPENSRFLAEKNNRVDKETVSRDTTLRYRNAAPRPSTTVKGNENAKGRDAVEEKVVRGNGGMGEDDRPTRAGQKKGAFEVPSSEKRDELALKSDGPDGPMRNQRQSDEIRGNSNRLNIQPGGEAGEQGEGSSGKAGEEHVLNLTPSAAVLDRIVGAPPSDVSRRFDDLEEGDGTFLNTREFKYSSFFNRVKQDVVVYWNPNAAIRQKDPNGEIYLYKDRYTVVSVTLDKGGMLKHVAVDQSSGVDFLDTEAVSAFRRASRFPNPPPGLTDDRGEIRFTFAFGVYLERGFMNIFRAN